MVEFEQGVPDAFGRVPVGKASPRQGCTRSMPSRSPEEFRASMRSRPCEGRNRCRGRGMTCSVHSISAEMPRVDHRR